MKSNILYYILITTVFFGACTTVKSYQKNKINDAEMSLGHRKVEKTETSAMLYREGASGANGGKNGGGCGCNKK